MTILLQVDLKPKTKDNKIKTAVLTIIVLAASLFAWLVLKRAFYTAGVGFTIENSAQFWQWFYLRVGWPLAALLAICSILALYLIAIRSRLVVFFTGVLIAGEFLFIFLNGNQLVMLCYSSAAILLIAALVAGDGAVDKEEKQRVAFSARHLAKRALVPIVFSLMILLSILYYFSPLAQTVKKIAVPDNIIDAIIKTASDTSGKSKDTAQDMPGFIKDYFQKNMPDSQGIIDDSAIENALKSIPGAENMNLGSSSSMIKDIKKQVNQQMDLLFSKYDKYLPILFTLSFFLMLKFISSEFIWIASLLAAALVKFCYVFGIFDKEVEMVEKERVVF